jgi:His-Xaa-Ser repeat protein HxsA
MSDLFLIPTLLAAGFGKTDPTLLRLTVLTTGTSGKDSGTIFEIFKQQHEVTLAGHRSHSSHSSHSSHQSGSSGGGHYSHTSHQSSTGGYGSTPAPAPAPLYTQPSPPAASPYYPPSADSSSETTSSTGAQKLATLGGRTKKFASIVRRVQIALLAQGDYWGPINGQVGPLTRTALRKFQSDHGLESTGTITPQTLDALKVPSQ